MGLLEAIGKDVNISTVPGLEAGKASKRLRAGVLLQRVKTVPGVEPAERSLLLAFAAPHTVFAASSPHYLQDMAMHSLRTPEQEGGGCLIAVGE